jgi:hypothetical protein
MRILVNGWIHPKNRIGIDLMNGKGIDFDLLPSTGTYDYVISTDSFVTPWAYSKGIIFGPHVSLESVGECPIGDNIYFNSLSPWLTRLSKEIFGDKNFVDLHFPVDIYKFKPNEKSGKPVFYHKRRNPEIMKEFFSVNNKEDFLIYDYTEGYKESDFLDSISKAPYAVWVGCHESQGFAMQETLSCNTPILVIDSKSLREETGGYWDNRLAGLNLPCTSASYFDERCGIVSDTDNWKKDLGIFKSSIITYCPREFVIETLSPESCINKWKSILDV